MTIANEHLARKIGRLDALIFFVVLASISLVSAAHPLGALPVIVFFLLPASALVGWRGAVSVRLILTGQASLRRAAIEGFVWGIFFAVSVFLWSLSKSTFAAGTVFDGLSPLGIQFWLEVAKYLIPACAILGTLGAITGMVFLYINRWLVQQFVK